VVRYRIAVGTLLTALALAGCVGGGPSAAPSPGGPATAVPPTTAPVRTTVAPAGPATARPATAPPADVSVLGPTGWAGLALGAPAGVAGASGIFADTPAADTGCRTWPALGAAAVEGAVISPRQGVVAILSAPDKVLRTPEGLQIGWAAAQVAGAYPDFAAGRAADVPETADVAVPGNPDAVYRLHFGPGARVDAFALVSRAADCPVQLIPA
jgi:hypothetical protein